MTVSWALQDAKNRLSELVNRTQTDGPQAITRRGRRVAVVLSAEDYAALAAPAATKEGLVAFLRASPLRGVKLDLARSDDTGRQVDL